MPKPHRSPSKPVDRLMKLVDALTWAHHESGFTRSDVALLRKPWHDDDCGALYSYDPVCDCHAKPGSLMWDSLADHIAALLPPEGA